MVLIILGCGIELNFKRLERWPYTGKAGPDLLPAGSGTLPRCFRPGWLDPRFPLPSVAWVMTDIYIRYYQINGIIRLIKRELPRAAHVEFRGVFSEGTVHGLCAWFL